MNIKENKVFFICLAAAAIVLIAALIIILLPNNENVNLFEDKTYKIIIDGKVLGTGEVHTFDGEKYLSHDIVKKTVDPYIWHDEAYNMITITTEHGLTRIDIKSEENLQSANVVLKDEKVFFKVKFIEDFYKITYEYNAENNVIIFMSEEAIQGEVVSKVNKLCIREGMSIKEARVKVLEEVKNSKTAVLLEKASDKWYKVMAFSGEIGYVKSSEVEIQENTTYKFAEMNSKMPGSAGGESEFKKDFSNKKINMVWEAVYNRKPTVEEVSTAKGIDVIAPTWFELESADGDILQKADIEIVDWAHSQGIYVWATIVSVTDCDMTRAFLQNQQARTRYLDEIMGYAEEYKLDGINVDFEYMYEEDKMLFTQFIRELSALCHERKLVLSCDVTILSQSPKWSLCYDRESLSQAVDYLCVMFYDQHSGGGKVAGSVGQISWAEDALNKLFAQVPAEQIIFGMPFYTRLWKEAGDEENLTVTSSVLTMPQTEKLLAERSLTPTWDEESGQFYTEYLDGNEKYRLWIEDAASIAKRVELVNKYKLAGCAAWRRGFETENIWNVIEESLND